MGNTCGETRRLTAVAGWLGQVSLPLCGSCVSILTVSAALSAPETQRSVKYVLTLDGGHLLSYLVGVIGNRYCLQPVTTIQNKQLHIYTTVITDG